MASSQTNPLKLKIYVKNKNSNTYCPREEKGKDRSP